MIVIWSYLAISLLSCLLISPTVEFKLANKEDIKELVFISLIPILNIILLIILLADLFCFGCKQITLETLMKFLYFLPVLALGLLWMM